MSERLRVARKRGLMKPTTTARPIDRRPRADAPGEAKRRSTPPAGACRSWRIAGRAHAAFSALDVLAHHRRARRPRKSRRARSNSATSRPSRITSTRSLMPSTSGSSLEIIRMATPCAGELAHQAMDLGLGADVDAARRLVEDQQLRIVGEPFAEHDLLLIAAGEPACDLVDRTRLDAEARDALVAPSAARRARSMKPEARQRAKRREREIVQDAHRPDQALRAAIFRHIGDALRARASRAS